MDKPDGYLIGRRFRVEKLLGEGGFGAVYKVADLTADPAGTVTRALKTLRADRVDQTLAARFLREAKALAGVSRHPGVAQVYDSGQDDEAGLYYVQDLVSGTNLFDRLLKGPLDLDEGFQRAIEFLDALAHVHSHGLVHRDIKPENLMLPGDGGAVILIDFGLAKELEDQGHLTKTGYIMGTPEYMALEQIEGMPYTIQTDLYQAALVIYPLLTGGERCFPPARNFAEVIAQRMIGPKLTAIRGREWYAGVAGRVEVLLACLKENPEERPESAAVVRDALVAAREEVAERPVEARAVSAPMRKPSGRLAVAQSTVVQKVSGSTIAAQQTVAGQTDRRSGRVASPHGSERVPATNRSGAVFATLGVGTLVVIAALITRPRTGPVVTPSVQADLVSPTPRMSIAPTPIDDDATLAREVRVALSKAKLDLEWLNEFASVQNLAVRKSPEAVATALRSELVRTGALPPLERFLTRGQAYFSDMAISQEEKWATRSALADVTLIEYFCQLHSIPWERICPAGSAVSCVSGVDEPARPWLLDLRAARTWGRHRENRDFGFFPGRSITDRWVFPASKLSEKMLLWYRLRRWRTSVVLDVSIANRLRRILAYNPSDNHNRVLPAFLAEWFVEGTTKTNWMYTPDPGEPLDNGYLACWVPAGLYGSPLTVTIRMVELPLGSATRSDPILYARCVSLVPRN